jgi:serine/threonine protein kinase
VLSEDFPAHLAGFQAGSLVAGYRLEAQVGAGGSAVVFRARDERLGRLVALKILAPALTADTAFRRRFMAESRAAAAVDDPHIIPVHEAGEAGGVLFIAMRFVRGGDLRRVLEREGALAPRRAAAFISPVASALDAAHRAGLVHRDVKPANILVDAREDRPDHVYLSDFGVSKGATASLSLTGPGQFLGTPDYSAPEQIQGRAVDGRTDQYALACVAYQLLTGAVPFERDQGLAVLLAHLSEPPPSASSRRPDLPAAVDQVLARALAKTPEKRYGTCRNFADALREALGLAPYVSLGSAAAPDHSQPQIAPPQPEFSRPAAPGTGQAAVPTDPAAAATIDSMPGGPAEAAQPDQRERAQPAAIQQAGEQARQEALRAQAQAPASPAKIAPARPRRSQGQEKNQREHPARRPANRALPRWLIVVVSGAAIAVIGVITVIFVLPGTPAPSFSGTSSPLSGTPSLLFARVSSNSNLLPGGSATGVAHLGIGRYEVTFATDVSGCAYVATTVHADSQTLQVFTAGGHSSSDGVYVETKNQGGGLANGPFNLVVDCGRPGTFFAVVGYTANLVRSSPGTTLTSLGVGRYDVNFTSNVGRCAYLATVGDPGNALAFDPVGVYTGSASSSEAVYIETKNKGGGLAADIPFHLAVICPTAASTQIAVVDADGSLARGSVGTHSSSPAPGQYVIATSRSISACAAVATRGSIDQSVPFYPTTVEIVPGPADNAVGIQLRDLLALGGKPASEAFHVAIVC